MNKAQTINHPPDGEGLLPGLSIDSVIFGFHEGQLKILLLEFRNTGLFALPGGFIHETENLDEAARRILSVRTGLHDIYLKQFYTFGDRDRRDAETQRFLMANMVDGTNPPDREHWLLRRFVSIGYYALIDFTRATPTPDALSDSCAWYDLSSLPSLIFDHPAIVRKALEVLQSNLNDRLADFIYRVAPLLPDPFTMGDLQQLYETILGKTLQRTNFQRKMLGLDVLERLEKKMSGGAHKAPYLYRFKSVIYPE